MHDRALKLLGVVVLCAALGADASAQRREPSATGQPAPGRLADSNLVVTSVFIRRDAVQRAAQQLAAADKTKPQGGLLASLKKTVSGDKHQLDAAKNVLGQQIVPLESDGRTLIVVIGTGADSAKVLESLSGVKRKVRVAFVNRDFADAVSDNTALKAGMAGAVTDASANLWVFLAKPGSPKREKPDRVLSTKLAGPSLWNGLFAADGDAIDVNQLKSDVGQVRSLVGKRDSTAAAPLTAATVATGSSEASAASPSAAPSGATGPAVGDVVVPKIANVKVLAQPSGDAKVLGTVQKADELVVTAAAQNGFIKVEGGTIAGWVNLLLVTKAPAGQK